MPTARSPQRGRVVVVSGAGSGIGLATALAFAADGAHLALMHFGELDAVESVIGPDILCWSSSLFVKEPGDDAYVAWHQIGRAHV